jgi:hypothetical protein
VWASIARQAIASARRSPLDGSDLLSNAMRSLPAVCPPNADHCAVVVVDLARELTGRSAASASKRARTRKASAVSETPAVKALRASKLTVARMVGDGWWALLVLQRDVERPTKTLHAWTWGGTGALPAAVNDFVDQVNQALVHGAPPCSAGPVRKPLTPAHAYFQLAIPADAPASPEGKALALLEVAVAARTRLRSAEMLNRALRMQRASTRAAVDARKSVDEALGTASGCNASASACAEEQAIAAAAIEAGMAAS